ALPGRRPRLTAWLWRMRWPRIRSSIGLRLALLALALGLPFVVYVGGNAARQAALERAAVKDRTLSLARLFAARVDDYVGDMVSALALVAHGASVDEASSASNDAFLHRIRADLPPAVGNVGIWTIEGRNIGALDRSNPTHDVNIGDRGYFRAAVRTRQLAIEGPIVSRISHDPVVLFARPVLGVDDRVVGVVTLSTKLRDLDGLLDLKGAAPAGTVVSIVNADGIVLARNIDPDRWIGMTVLNVGNARTHIATREGVDETHGSDNIERIAAYTQASRVDWHLFVGVPSAAALASTRTNLAEMLLFGTLSLVVGTVLAASLGVRIARPLRRLAYDATLFARGNLAHRTRVAGDDETGVLAGTFNRMAQQIEDRTRSLQEKTAALERSTNELATITANVPVLIAYVDATGHFRFVNEYFRDVFGAAPERIVGRTLRDFLGDDVHARLEGHVRDVMAGLPQTFEASLTPGARAPVFIVTCFPDHGAAHDVRGAYVVAQDITRRKEAEEALHARERFVRLIADAIPARITYSDPNERLLFGNRRFAEYWGSDPASIVGQRVADIVSPVAYRQIGPELARSYRGETRRFDLVVPRDD
ncbi:MAG TPA: PAS domain-containing protein, partial [Casimicrobiaceae bacterium]|nr:PAS domain-containing protein [Casimicrobiaceae bacterium]